MDNKWLKISVVAVFCLLTTMAVPLLAQAADDESHGQNATGGETTGRSGGEIPTQKARASLAGGQMIHGALFGLQTCALIECYNSLSGDSAGIFLPIAGAAAGLGISMRATSDRGITSGHAWTINAGSFWGGWLGLATANAMDLDPDSDSYDFALGAGLMMAGQLVGTAGGHYLAKSRRPTPSDLLAFHAGAILAPVYFSIITEELLNKSVPKPMVTTLGVSAAGGLLTSQIPMSGRRLGTIYLSGLAGGWGGTGMAHVLDGRSPSNRLQAGSIITGLTLGVALGFFFTRGWDDEDNGAASAAFRLTPTAEADGVQATVSGQW